VDVPRGTAKELFVYSCTVPVFRHQRSGKAAGTPRGNNAGTVAPQAQKARAQPVSGNLGGMNNYHRLQKYWGSTSRARAGENEMRGTLTDRAPRGSLSRKSEGPKRGNRQFRSLRERGLVRTTLVRRSVWGTVARVGLRVWERREEKKKRKPSSRGQMSHEVAGTMKEAQFVQGAALRKGQKRGGMGGGHAGDRWGGARPSGEGVTKQESPGKPTPTGVTAERMPTDETKDQGGENKGRPSGEMRCQCKPHPRVGNRENIYNRLLLGVVWVATVEDVGHSTEEPFYRNPFSFTGERKSLKKRWFGFQGGQFIPGTQTANVGDKSFPRSRTWTTFEKVRSPTLTEKWGNRGKGKCMGDAYVQGGSSKFTRKNPAGQSLNH